MNDSQLKQTSMRDFQILCKLGEGSFSQVFKVKRLSDGQEYALKKVKMGQLKDKEKENALNEVRILASLTDQFIVGYKECFIEESTSTLCIVMEFANGGDLQKKINDHIKNKTYFPEYEVWKSFIHMTRGLKVLHDMKILHRDLKCANIFMTKGGVYKLGDLNVSKVAKNKLVYTQTGTPYYASPEVWRDEPYDNKSDIWSLGCVVYEMCGLKPPFRANDMEGLFRKVQKGIFDRIPNRYSKELQQMIAACLQVNPSNRPDCDQLLENPIVIRNQPADSSSRPQSAKVKQNFSLLQTIKLPKNLSQLKGKLPKANYDQLAIDDDTQEDFNPFKGNNIRVAPQSAQPSKRTNPFGFNNNANTNSSPEQQQQALLQQQLIQQQQLQQLQQQQQVIAKKYPQRPNPHATNKMEAPKQVQQVQPSSQLPENETESLDLMPSLNPILKGELMNQSQQQQQQNKKSLISLVKENDIPMYSKPPEIDVKPNYSSNNNNNNNNGNYGQQYGSNIRTPVVQEKTPSNLKQVNGRPSAANRRPQSGIQNVGSPLYKQQQENSQEKIMPNNSGILRDRRNQIKQAPSQSRLQQQQNTPTSMLPNPKNRPISAQYDYMLGNNNNNYSNPNQNVGGRIAPPEMPQMKNLRQLEKVNSQNLISREVLLMQEKLAQKQKALFSQQQQQQQQYQQQQQQLQQQIPQSAMQPQRNQNNSRVAIVNGYQMPELHNNNNNNKGAMGRNNQRIQSAKALLQGLPSKDLMPQQIYNREQFLSPQNNNANSRLAQQQNMRPGLVNPYSYASNNNNNNAQGLNGLGYVNNYGYGSNNNNNNNAYIQPKNQLPVSPVREITNSGLYSNNGYGYGSRQSRQQRPVVNSPVQRPTWWG